MAGRSGRYRSGEDPESKLVAAHRLIMQAAEGPSMALLKGKASRSSLSKSRKNMRLAISLIEEVIDA